MGVTHQTEWAEHALRSLREAGYRSGGGRRQVVELLAEEGCALTALEIDERLARVGRATVYRSLEQLEELNLVKRVGVGGGAAGYERVGPDDHHHHHIVCETCGKVVPFEDSDLERAISGVARDSDFRVKAHEVTLQGVCAACGRRAH